MAKDPGESIFGTASGVYKEREKYSRGSSRARSRTKRPSYNRRTENYLLKSGYYSGPVVMGSRDKVVQDDDLKESLKLVRKAVNSRNRAIGRLTHARSHKATRRKKATSTRSTSSAADSGYSDRENGTEDLRPPGSEDVN